MQSTIFILCTYNYGNMCLKLVKLSEQTIYHGITATTVPTLAILLTYSPSHRKTVNLLPTPGVTGKFVSITVG